MAVGKDPIAGASVVVFNEPLRNVSFSLGVNPSSFLVLESRSWLGGHFRGRDGLACNQ